MYSFICPIFLSSMYVWVFLYAFISLGIYVVEVAIFLFMRLSYISVFMYLPVIHIFIDLSSIFVSLSICTYYLFITHLFMYKYIYICVHIPIIICLCSYLSFLFTHKIFGSAHFGTLFPSLRAS